MQVKCCKLNAEQNAQNQLKIKAIRNPKNTNVKTTIEQATNKHEEKFTKSSGENDRWFSNEEENYQLPFVVVGFCCVACCLYLMAARSLSIEASVRKTSERAA